MTVFLKRCWNKIFNSSGPALKESYDIADGDTLLATLTQPDTTDQFWVQFLLTPITADIAKLAILYSSDFWYSDRIIITESNSSRRVNFILSFDIIETDTEVTFIDNLKDRPPVIKLRGPY